MKTGTNLNILLLMCCLSVGILVSANTTRGEEPVYFADTILKTVVERKLGVSEPTSTDMLALTTLKANNSAITDLTGLEYATNLTVLELVNHRISDMSVIAGLKNLTELSLGYNRIGDISAVAGLTRLTSLSLSKNRISDISAVAGLTNLTELYLYDNQISDISAVGGLTNLTKLYLYGNRISDISAVAWLTNLTELHLGDNQVSDISAVAGLENLKRLSLNNNRISDISPADGLTNLTHLHLQDNQIRDISVLLGLTNLIYLRLRRNPLSQNSCDIYIPQIRENNPGMTVYYDPYVQYTLMISSTAGGFVSVPGEGVFPYDYGGTLPIVASADTGYHFVFWTGTAVDAGSVVNPTAANTTVKLYSDYMLKAHFAMDRCVIYVDDDATGLNDGSSWADAYMYLQDALTNADNSAKPVEIRVAQGIYKPDRGVGITQGDWNATFRLINGVTLKGCYAGCGETDPNARDIRLHQTILSGDLNGDDPVVYDRGDFWHDRMWSDNSHHVVTTRQTNDSAVLDGFQITSGYCLGSPPIVFDPPAFYGGGLAIIAASPTVVDCTFAGNAVTAGGGAIVNLEGSSPTLVNCKFERNYAGSGGAISNSNSKLKLIKCHFYQNFASGGGAISGSRDGSIDLRNCSFVQNTAKYSGGAIDVPSVGGRIGPEIIKQSCFARAENCIFAGNTVDSAAWWACGIVCGCAWLTNCTFSGNRVSCGSVAAGDTFLENCIIWGNFVTGQPSSGVRSLTYHCCIQDSTFYLPGNGNIYSDPYFASPGYWADSDDPNIPAETNDPNSIWVDGDYHLKSQAGRWNPNSRTWVTDDVTSPCIDAGDPGTPIGLEPLPNGGIINMGAYGGTPQVSMSLSTVGNSVEIAK
jgi:hypothetical protein